MSTPVTDRSASAPESPARGATSSADRWPAWFAPAGFFLAATLSGLLSSVLAAVSGAASGSPGLALVSTLALDGSLALMAVGLASLVGRPHAADFGLRPTRLWPAVRVFLLAAVAYYGLSAAYSAAFSPDGEQDVVQSFGADESLLLLIGAGFLVVLVAPYAEELFFRGFFYRALRNRLGVAGATIVVGLVFGAIHYSGSETVPLLPVLALFGVVLCLVYQRTGSLYPAIALHALNNGLALASATGDAAGAVVAGSFATLAIASCVAIPALQRRVRSRSPRPARRAGS